MHQVCRDITVVETLLALTTVSNGMVTSHTILPYLLSVFGASPILSTTDQGEHDDRIAGTTGDHPARSGSDHSQ